MKHMKAVIGAGYGDEGKGFITYGESRWAEGRVLNVLYNGGVQRGHTAGGHVFHCFGSGLFAGADTYYDKKFMVNPIGWLQERDQLRMGRMGVDFDGRLYVNKACPVTTPYDIILNQLVETKRGDNRHGSCGLGIWETARRHLTMPLFAWELAEVELYNNLRQIEEKYFRPTCEEYGVVAPDYINIDPFMQAVAEMVKSVEFVWTSGSVMQKYDTVIFEGGQGLMLSEDNIFMHPNVTASCPGLKYIAKYFDDAESYMEADEVKRDIIYVTRSYATRHGAGRFRGECAKEEINPNMIDHTNQTNEWQGELRYGRLDVAEMSMQIKMDLEWLSVCEPNVSLAVTQLNLTNDMMVTTDDNFPPKMLAIEEVDEVQMHHYDDLFWVKKHLGVARMREICEVLG